MSMEAIVYTSNTGHTAAYARLLGEKTGLAVFTLDEAIRTLEKGKTVIYMGWLGASHVKGLPKAQKYFDMGYVIREHCLPRCEARLPLQSISRCLLCREA